MSVYGRNIKKCMGEHIEESYIVNLYRGMSKLKLKINVNLPQLLCIVVYYINTSEIPSELSRTREDNMLSSHVKRSRALSLLH